MGATVESAHVIETTLLTRTFGARVAVDRVNLRVPAGVIYGFLGPNGAGKTTTIRMLLGLTRPTSGSVRLFGETFSRERRKLLQEVGALVEEPSLYPHLTGRENLEIIRRLRNRSRQDVDALLQQFEFASAARDVVATYSSGMRQTLGLAAACLGQPRLLILDEPTNGLDPGATRKLRALLRGQVERHGVTVFVSSHILGEVEQLADWVGIIDHGRLLFQGTLTSLRGARPGSLEDIFLELVASSERASA